MKYDPDVDSKAGVECVGGEWDTSDMPTVDDCDDDVACMVSDAKPKIEAGDFSMPVIKQIALKLS